MEILNSVLIILIFVSGYIIHKYALPSYFNSRIEHLRSELSKTVAVHQLQFENEFQAFKEIWEKLLDLRYKTLSLRPILDHRFASDEENEKEKQRRLAQFADSFNAFLNLAEKNKPFYPPEIWEKLNAVITIARKEAVGYQYGDMEHDRKQYWDEAIKNRQTILDGIDAICEAIRSRLELLKTV